MSDDLVSLVEKANPQAFHDEVRRRLENDETPSMVAATFTDLTLTGFDFSDLDMTHCAFEGCTLSECQFENTTLEGAFFDGVTLLHCNFEGGNLEGWAIDASTLGSCTFENVDLTDNEWTNSRCNETVFESVSAETWWLEQLTFKGGQWRDVDVGGGAWSHVTLRDLSINGLDLGDADITHCYHVNAAIHGRDWPDGFIEKSGERKTIG